MKRGAKPFASVEPGCETSCVPVLSLREDAVEDLLLVFAEVVVAQAGGEAQLSVTSKVPSPKSANCLSL